MESIKVSSTLRINGARKECCYRPKSGPASEEKPQSLERHETLVYPLSGWFRMVARFFRIRSTWEPRQ